MDLQFQGIFGRGSARRSHIPKGEVPKEEGEKIKLRKGPGNVEKPSNSTGAGFDPRLCDADYRMSDEEKEKRRAQSQEIAERAQEIQRQSRERVAALQREREEKKPPQHVRKEIAKPVTSTPQAEVTAEPALVIAPESVMVQDRTQTPGEPERLPEEASGNIETISPDPVSIETGSEASEVLEPAPAAEIEVAISHSSEVIPEPEISPPPVSESVTEDLVTSALTAPAPAHEESLESHHNDVPPKKPEKFNMTPSKTTDTHKPTGWKDTGKWVVVVGASLWLVMVLGINIGKFEAIPFASLIISVVLMFSGVGLLTMAVSPVAAKRGRYIFTGALLLSVGAVTMAVNIIYSHVGLLRLFL